jgi:hypothetical protein
MAWTRIVRTGKPRVRGANAQYSGLIDVEIDLSTTPPPEWAQAFVNPSGVEMSMGRRRPTLSGATVETSPPDDQLEAAVAEVDARIEAANSYFESRVLPALNAAEAQARQRRADEQKRIDDARRKADDL